MKIKIEKLDNFGRGISYLNNKICFVKNALENEIVEINILDEKKKYITAETTKIINKSKKRIDTECPYSNICGGCQLNHISYEDENNWKEEKIKDILKKYANIPNNIVEKIKYHERNNYRNKIVLHGFNNKLGYKLEKSNKIIPINKCLIANKKINNIIKLLQSQNISEAIIKTSNDESQVMVKITGNINNIEELTKSCDVLIINEEYITKQKSIESTIGTKKYKVGIDSFFQVNKTLTKELYDEVLLNVKDKGYNEVLDLYCGTGTIGIYISEYVKHIIGIDYNDSNIEDANYNKELNKVKNIYFICDKVENQIDKYNNIDLIIVDPPRAGLDDKTKNIIKKINPKQLLYVSCDPMTLARDLNELKDNFNIIKITPFNMFPRTYHCESVTVLERR